MGLHVLAECWIEGASELRLSGPPNGRLLAHGDEAYVHWCAQEGVDALHNALRDCSALPTFAVHLVRVPEGESFDPAWAGGLPAVAALAIASGLYAFDGEGFLLVDYAGAISSGGFRVLDGLWRLSPPTS